jgi:GTPase SAR1 family protein
MKEEWERVFKTDRQLYFGDLFDNNMLKDYYFEDKNLEMNRTIILSYINDEMDYSPILIGGDAGVGKSTFINNLVLKHLPNNSYYNIVLDVDNQPNNPMIKEHLMRQLDNYLQLLTDGKIIGSNITSKQKIEYQKYIANEMLYKNKEERINDVITIISKTVKHLNAKKQIYPKLVIFLDQVEKFGLDTLVNYISEYLGFISSSKYIKFILCARKETIKISKQSVKGFFPTYFKRYIEIKSPPIERVLQKRIYIGRNRNITIELINNYFTRAFCDLIENISNNNLRVMLRIFEKLIETTKPYEGRDGYVYYFISLVQNGYIDNLYRKINQADNIPIIKIVFDAIHYYGSVDEKFYRVIITKALTIGISKEIIGLTKENINIAIQYLFDNDFITDSFEFINKYSFTKKGEAYSKFIELDSYSKLYIKEFFDDRFKRNIFADQDFSRAESTDLKTKVNRKKK